ncbi:hypothetical protein FHX46_001218 [Amycolatopsis viridis]|uniref:Uncharacterized protein n=1 Tax=Amycolatopsis viridis TaxID=185678 RepID=A0ABX0SQ66_9PSEU|nr:hypothetical protein [Amycolatopsis viridis]
MPTAGAILATVEALSGTVTLSGKASPVGGGDR